VLAGSLAIVGGLAIGAGLLSGNNPQPQPEHSAPSEQTASPASSPRSDNRDPATAWDAPADEIERLGEDLSPFEIRAQNLWDESTQNIKE
jgi:hypothetical protein